MGLLENLNQRSKFFWWLMGFLFIPVFGVIDNYTGSEFRFSFFYLVPIAFISWFTGMRAGVVAALASTLVWLVTNLLLGTGFSHPIVAYGNAATLACFYLVIALLLAKLRKVLQREKASANTDYLTGALNSRAFYELAQMEMDRARRYAHPFTLAYFDVDNFKAVNDRSGHSAGDRLLQLIVETIKKNIRITDSVARLGGDEFAVLFPESNYEAVEQMLGRIRAELSRTDDRQHAQVTFSVGALTCQAPPATVDELMLKVDRLMYTAKNDGKDRIEHETLTDDAQE